MSLRVDILADYEVMSLSGKRPTWSRVIWLWVWRLAFRVVLNYRLGYWCRKRGLRFLGAWFDRRNWKMGVDICSAAEIGKGLRLAHPHGVVISGNSKIGQYAHVLQGVTLGGSTQKERPDGDSVQVAPYVGDFVMIGAGAKLVGPVRVGSNVIIGANAVVTKDIPDNAIAVGVPVRVIGHKTDVGNPAISKGPIAEAGKPTEKIDCVEGDSATADARRVYPSENESQSG